ncbi:uncharacterized protein K452DRAFT_317509 [Aplosporella prunicola CBS 121167]|uniref:Uncharacterized protein n=1 Tax=Aplosporella prunicola CBS 121167 TaxID=1176127 RepID=A0A6A6BGS1_9PEZI|nr:uncharacterized protein K452DRAFT_317509 [Aplosporella prunicola CBS 121167]KAF2143350.1 hypothetical protein K452DRAFT_317509 [Aplosporella prunicola CBS 121167]
MLSSTKNLTRLRPRGKGSCCSPLRWANQAAAYKWMAYNKPLPKGQKQKPAIGDYAFNVSAYGYDHGIKDRKPYQVIRVSGVSSAPLTSIQNTVAATEYVSKEEVDLSAGSEGALAVVVGMVPRGFNQYTTEEINKRIDQYGPNELDKKHAPKGSTIADLTTFPLIETDPQALRVVVPLRNCPFTMAYALVNPVNGLCQGYKISKRDIFFFKEFRDDMLNSIKKRKILWVHCVRDYIKEKLKEDGNDTETALRHLIDPHKPFNGEDADAVMKECLGLWPALRVLDIKNDEVMALATAIREEDATIPFKLLRPLLVQWVYCLRAATDTSVVSVVAVKLHVSLQFGEDLSRAPLTEHALELDAEHVEEDPMENDTEIRAIDASMRLDMGAGRAPVELAA